MNRELPQPSLSRRDFLRLTALSAANLAVDVAFGRAADPAAGTGDAPIGENDLTGKAGVAAETHTSAESDGTIHGVIFSDGAVRGADRGLGENAYILASEVINPDTQYTKAVLGGWKIGDAVKTGYYEISSPVGHVPVVGCITLPGNNPDRLMINLVVNMPQADDPTKRQIGVWQYLLDGASGAVTPMGSLNIGYEGDDVAWRAQKAQNGTIAIAATSNSADFRSLNPQFANRLDAQQHAEGKNALSLIIAPADRQNPESPLVVDTLLLRGAEGVHVHDFGEFVQTSATGDVFTGMKLASHPRQEDALPTNLIASQLPAAVFTGLTDNLQLKGYRVLPRYQDGTQAIAAGYGEHGDTALLLLKTPGGQPLDELADTSIDCNGKNPQTDDIWAISHGTWQQLLNSTDLTQPSDSKLSIISCLPGSSRPEMGQLLRKVTIGQTVFANEQPTPDYRRFGKTGGDDVHVTPLTMESAGMIDHGERLLLGGEGNEQIHGVAPLPDGRFIVFGGTTSTTFLGGKAAETRGFLVIADAIPNPSGPSTVYLPLVAKQTTVE